MIDVASKPRRIKIEKPIIQSSQEEALWKDVQKYADMVPSEPDVNMGRVQEIKEEIAKGTYMTRDKIEAAAANIAMRLAKREL